MKTHQYWHETKQTIGVALPLIAANLVQASTGFISTIMLARLGTKPLAASGLVSSLYFMVVVSCWGMLSGLSVLIAQAHGAKQFDNISRLMRQGMGFAILISIPMMLLMWILPWFLADSVSDPSVLKLSTEYLHAMSWIVIPGSCLVWSEQLLIGLQKSTAVMVISLLSVPLEIVASYLLIYGKFGLPECGVAGIGYGLAVAYTIVAVLTIVYISLHKELAQYQIFKRLPRVKYTLLYEIFRIGWPIGAMYGIEVGLFAALALLMGQVGAIALAAHQIIMQFMSVAIMITFGFMTATSIRVGHAIGRKDYAILPCIGHVGMLLSSMVAIVIGIAYCSAPEWIVSLDVGPEQASRAAILSLTTKLLFIAAIYQVAESVRIVAMGALRGMKDTRVPMINSFISFWLVGFTLSYILGLLLDGQAAGLWWGVTLGIISGAVFLVHRYQKLAKNPQLLAAV